MEPGIVLMKSFLETVPCFLEKYSYCCKACFFFVFWGNSLPLHAKRKRKSTQKQLGIILLTLWLPVLCDEMKTIIYGKISESVPK